VRRILATLVPLGAVLLAGAAEPLVGEGRAAFRRGAGPTSRPCGACHVQGGIGGAGATVAQRQTPALWGVAALAAIPEGTIEAGVWGPGAPRGVTRGRVGYTEEGVGRFGWKAETASLDTLVANGCLAGNPPAAPVALTRYLHVLPAPVRLTDTPGAARGEALFHALACADCHVPSLGEVDGVYSDLLLHDLGADLAVRPPSGGSAPPPPEAHTRGREEWRTPPLWGLRDSAPYLHDGRAPDVSAAIAAHGGDAAESALAWRVLPAPQREAVLTFLDTLAAP